MILLNPLSSNVLRCLLYCFTLSNAQWQSQPDYLVMQCKFFRVHGLQKQSISKEMNDNNDPKFVFHDQIVQLALPLLTPDNITHQGGSFAT